MDIYEYAEKFNADYMTPDGKYIYKIQDYNQRKRLGLPNPKIEVLDNDTGKSIGYAEKLK